MEERLPIYPLCAVTFLSCASILLLLFISVLATIGVRKYEMCRLEYVEIYRGRDGEPRTEPLEFRLFIVLRISHSVIRMM